ncbi:MAG: sigma 54-interacting transcriptional regulator, partial [Polyangiaceae bacterium]|nr:sigma 54-interacting transcriptional regulator [Polyangiaceae bacterium]
SELLTRAGSTFSQSCRTVPWVRAALAERTEGDDAGSWERTKRLEHLVRGLGAEAKLAELLRNVLDALVGWTGVERGLLLLRAPDGRLVPKVARNLARRDLAGDQLRLSMTLAARALERLEPVVAVDAAGELSDLHTSVHALRLRSVLAVPLVAHGDAVGVVYLDDRVRRGAFGERELAWVRTLSTLAATAVARALSEAKLRRAHARAARRGRELERVLAEREARLSVALSSLEGREGRTAGAAFQSIVGRSAAIERTIRIADRIAASEVPVLVIGESGSGKELFARAIHEASRRATSSFVSENCSAIPDTLLESALFGHVRGAFTGADRSRIGLFAAANGGTLFLDEIGEMHLAMQTKLLRILEDGIVRPLGTERSQKVDVRLIAATHRDLEQMVGEKRFREDLFYRLNVVPLRIPPLRERREDISLLVDHFVKTHAPNGPARVTRAALAALEQAPWPGNVRQLENEIRRALVLSDGTIDVEHLSFAEAQAKASQPARDDIGLDVRKRVDQLETELVREAMKKTKGNQTQAAKLLGLSRFGLQKMIKRLGLNA